MAWITPITNRESNSRTTATDMNRITGNINHLLGTTLKADYTSADIVKDTEWKLIIEHSSQMASESGTPAVTSATTWLNLNNIEKAALAYSAYDPRKPSDSLYPGDSVYPY